MEYWSDPVRSGVREWELTNISGGALTVEQIRSFDGVSLPFLVVENGLGQTVNPNGRVRVRFRPTSICNSFNGLVLAGRTGEGLAWTVRWSKVRV